VPLRLASDERLVRLTRRGDRAAFEALYDRHAPALMSFCTYMLASPHDAEDALQATFLGAHRGLLTDERPIALRPWLFTIARNACVSILRQRRPWMELNGEPALNGDPVHQLEVREDVQRLVDGLLSLPEPQRAALVLAELQGLKQDEIADVLGVQTKQVKAYAYQARANLIAERAARDTDCAAIREELATAHGANRLKSKLRRHLRTCEACRDFDRGVVHHRRQLNALLPVIVPSLALRSRTIQETLGVVLPGAYPGAAIAGGGAAGTAVLAGGGMKLIATMAAGVACLGVCGASLLDGSGASETSTAAVSTWTGTAPTDLTATVASATGPLAAMRAGHHPGDVVETRAGGLPPSEITAGSEPTTTSGALLTVGGGSGASGLDPQGEAGEPASPGPPGEANRQHVGSSYALGEAHEDRSINEGRVRAREAEKHAREAEKRSNSAKRRVAQEQRTQAAQARKELRDQEREKEKAEREEHKHQLHGLPPEVRKRVHEEEKAEREQERAERESPEAG
jgi:RNA polymerase sigma factor (sigma-70 family)